MARVIERGRRMRGETKDKVYVAPVAFKNPLTLKVSLSPHTFPEE